MSDSEQHLVLIRDFLRAPIRLHLIWLFKKIENTASTFNQTVCCDKVYFQTEIIPCTIFKNIKCGADVGYFIFIHNE